MAGAAGVSHVRSGTVTASQRFTPVGSLKVLNEEPRYRGLVVAWFVWGVGSFMAAPLYALVLVDRFQASYADIGVLALIGTLVMARAVGLRLRDVPLLGTVLANALRPRGNLGVGHRVLGQRADVAVAQALDVEQVLLARQDRPLADALGGRRSAHRIVQTPQQIVHDPARDPLTLAGVDVAEQHQVRQQNTPVRAKTAHDALPV